MNILFLEAGESGHGGSFVSLLQMLTLLKKQGFQLTVILWNQSVFIKQYENLGVRVIQINNPIYTIGNTKIKSLYNKLTSLSIRLVPSLCVYIELLLQYTSYKKIIKIAQENNITILHLNNQPIRNFIGYWVAKKLKVPVITHLRTLHHYGFTAAHTNFIKTIKYKMLAVSNAVKQCWSEAGIPSECIRVLHNPFNGVVESDIASVQKVAKKIVYIGRLEPGKGVDFLLESFALTLRACPHITLSIIGSGSLYQHLFELSSRLGIDNRVFFLGYIKNAKQQLSQFDILVLPSENEGFGRVLIEAMGYGVCTVATEVGGICDIIENSVNGLLVKYADKIGLAKALVLVSTDAALRKEMIQNAYKTVKNKFNEKLFSQQLVNEYQEINSDRNYDIAIVISDLGSGGTQRVVSQLIAYWNKRNKAIAVITLASHESDFFTLPSGVDRYVIGGIGVSKNKWVGLVANLKRIIKLRKQLIAIKPKKILSFLCATNILTLFATRKLNYRVVISERNDPERQSFGFIWNLLRKKYYRQADIVTANTRKAIETLSRYVPRNKLKWIQNPIAELVADNPVTFASPTVLAVGRLHQQKAYDILLQAFAIFHHNHPQWRLAIIGEGDLRKNLEIQTKYLGIVPYVTWYGRVNNPFSYYFASEIFVMPSRHEGMPNALLEAISCDLPVIMSDALPGPLEYIENNISGLVVPVEDAAALAQALSRLASDKALRERFAAVAKEKLSSHSIDQVIDVWDSVLNEES